MPSQVSPKRQLLNEMVVYESLLPTWLNHYTGEILGIKCLVHLGLAHEAQEVHENVLVGLGSAMGSCICPMGSLCCLPLPLFLLLLALCLGTTCAQPDLLHSVMTESPHYRKIARTFSSSRAGQRLP